MMVVILAAIVFVTIVQIPFFCDIFGITSLQNPTDYLLVLGSAAIWVVVVQLFWRIFPVATKMSGNIASLE